MKKNIACSYCKGKGYNTVMTGIRGDYCGVMNETCPKCNGTGVDLADMTNADRIRAMTDEELARFIANKIVNLENHKMIEQGHTPTATQLSALEHTCYCTLVQWLQQPAEGE